MPVVNPMVFYWMSVADKLDDVLFLGSVFLVVGTVIAWFGVLNCDDCPFNKKQVKMLTALTIAFIIAHTAFPDKQTIEKMVVAQNVTYERVEQATDVVSNVYNDIMDLFKEDAPDE